MNTWGANFTTGIGSAGGRDGDGDGAELGDAAGDSCLIYFRKY